MMHGHTYIKHVSACVAPYFVYIINHFFGLFSSPVYLVIISHMVRFSEKSIDIKCVL